MKLPLALLTLCILTLGAAKGLYAQTMHLTNGKWFDGMDFIPGDWYVAEGALSKKLISNPDTIIDLQGKFVIPPFGEAHNHSLEQPFGLQETMQKYLKQGIFYFKNPNSIPALSDGIKDQFFGPGNIDIIYANGGLTGTDGHPVVLYDRLWDQFLKYSFPGKDRSVLVNQAYWLMDTQEEFDEMWPLIKSQEPSFIKLYLLNSEAYQSWKDDTLYAGRKGLNPELIPHLIQTIHQSGLRISMHVETSHDFMVAVSNGVDELNHLPGYSFNKHGHNQVLDEEMIKLAVSKGVVMVPTYSVMNTFLRFSGDTLDYQRTRKIQAQNLQNLKRHGAVLAIGCDNYFETSRSELFYLQEFNIFSNLELLKMFTENTLKAIFPNRKIGKLEPGYEASFLVLDENPLMNLEAIKGINFMVKEGKILQVE